MVLFITNKDDLTTDFVVREIVRAEVPFYRFNTEELGVTVFVTLDFHNSLFFLYDSVIKKKYDIKDFTSVYYRRPVLREMNETDLTDAELQFLKMEHYQTLEGLYKILKSAYWINPVFAIREAENKLYQQQLAIELGFTTPASIVTNIPEDFFHFYESYQNNCVIKPIRSGQIGIAETEKVVYTSRLDRKPSKKTIKLCPSYLQEEIKKTYDVRVTVVGEKVFATAIYSQDCEDTKTDWRKGEHILPHKEINLPDSISKKCRYLLNTLNLRFGAIDFIYNDKGDYIFLEINPNGQWAWIECRTNYKISTEIAKLLIHENE